MAEILADDFSIDDRRRVVNIGIRNGRDVEIANMRAAAEIGTKAMTFVVIATRGKRLALSRIRASGRDQRPEAFHTEALGIVEINADNRIVARVAFDLDDIDAAFKELDARYLAGEAAEYAHTWSVIAGAYAAFNRHELFATTPDWANIDHRRGIGFAPGDMIPYIRASWDVTPDLIINIEAVHRLSDVGAVVTHATQGTSQEGFDAEWRVISLLTVKGDLINRCERFDEADIDAALARFDELSRPAPRLENAATRVTERFQASLTARDWDAMAEIMADDISNDDRRRVVNAGIRRGRGGRDRRTCGQSPISVLRSPRRTSLRPAGNASRSCVCACRFATRMPGVRRRVAQHRRDRHRRPHRGNRHFRPSTTLDAAFEELDARYPQAKRPPTRVRGRLWRRPLPQPTGAKCPSSCRTL